MVLVGCWRHGAGGHENVAFVVLARMANVLHAANDEDMIVLKTCFYNVSKNSQQLECLFATGSAKCTCCQAYIAQSCRALQLHVQTHRHIRIDCQPATLTASCTCSLFITRGPRFGLVMRSQAYRSPIFMADDCHGLVGGCSSFRASDEKAPPAAAAGTVSRAAAG